MFSLTGGIPHNPDNDVPLAKLKINVSMLSDNVCAVAIFELYSFDTSLKNLYLSIRAHSSTPILFFFEYFNMSIFFEIKQIFHLLHISFIIFVISWYMVV